MSQQKTLCTGVLVIGGGTAGCVAALAAAGEGAAVILVESDSALGGVATRGGIHRYYYGSPGGLQETIDRRAEEAAKIFGGETKGFHPDAKRVVLAEMCAEYGVKVYLDSVVYEVIMEQSDVTGVRVLTPEGRLDIEAEVTIDCTGNASLVRMAGGGLRYGRELDGIYHNYSLIPRRLHEGQIGYDNLDAGWVDPYDPWDVSRAFIRGRERIREDYAAGSHYFAVSSMLGVREGGLINGDAVITMDDYIEDTPSPEIISRSYSHLDNHGFDTGNESDFSQLWISVLGLFVKGLWCDIPYGSLLPQGIGRLLVAGRSLSVERDVGMGVRMQKDMHKVGEAAGTAAALSIRNGCSPRNLDRSVLQARLVERKVIEAKDLHRTKGRNLQFRHGALADADKSPAELALMVPELLDYLDTEERWKAVWLLAGRRGSAPDPDKVAALVQLLQEGTRESKFCAAVILSMLGRREPEPYLLELITARESSKLGNHPKCVPFWIASFILLGMLKSTSALKEARSVLAEQPSSVFSTFILNYISAVTAEMTNVERSIIAAAVKQWLASPGLGSDYRMHGERLESLRWSLELRAAAFLAACPGEEETVHTLTAKRYGDSRGFVRNAVQRLVPEYAPAAHEGGEACLGEFEAAVIGGSAAGVLCAAALSRQGKQVVLLESSSSLMTEVTRSRQTVFPALWTQQDDELLEFAEVLRAAGAWDGQQLEPVLAQLAADRFLTEAGVRILFEVRLLEEQLPEHGGAVLTVAHKGGTGTIKAGEIMKFSSESRPAAGPGGTITSLLLGVPAEAETFYEIKGDHDVLRLRIRPGFYPDESYLDVRWHGEARQEKASGEIYMVQAMKELRSRGIIPDSAALAYIADQPWAGSGLERGDTCTDWSSGLHR
ncbi:hypothetical protein C2I18_26485 [Paenibacillus sp. PK3_47]|uniref:FAD-dependent oxidoreductase n=1 Tax=Paenibacillus sp. PK3_47 TaxID=2072642 RepID=UPI00201DBF1B|nr:FAD-dependent oxidoreductase [Paenibacillus sp. PK3_47]UQZ36767.1 hypothetical protein C2I18_26485 [Paenibacillus sp. PK3_47]